MPKNENKIHSVSKLIIYDDYIIVYVVLKCLQAYAEKMKKKILSIYIYRVQCLRFMQSV